MLGWSADGWPALRGPLEVRDREDSWLLGSFLEQPVEEDWSDDPKVRYNPRNCPCLTHWKWRQGSVEKQPLAAQTSCSLGTPSSWGPCC